MSARPSRRNTPTTSGRKRRRRERKIRSSNQMPLLTKRILVSRSRMKVALRICNSLVVIQMMKQKRRQMRKQKPLAPPPPASLPSSLRLSSLPTLRTRSSPIW